jgi:hypothetical protein
VKYEFEFNFQLSGYMVGLSTEHLQCNVGQQLLFVQNDLGSMRPPLT